MNPLLQNLTSSKMLDNFEDPKIGSFWRVYSSLIGLYLSNFVSIFLRTSLSLKVSILSLSLSLYKHFSLFISFSVSISFSVFISCYVYLFHCLYLFLCLSLIVSIFLSVCISLYFCLSLCISLSLSQYISLSLKHTKIIQKISHRKQCMRQHYFARIMRSIFRAKS